MKTIFIYGLVIALLLLPQITIADTLANRYAPDQVPAMVKLSTMDRFFKQIWPDLPESYRIMAAISASMLVNAGHQYVNRAFNESAPGEKTGKEPVGISFTIEW